MRLYGKQILRTVCDIDKFFLCPYAYVELNPDGIYISRIETEEGFLIEHYPVESLISIFNSLLNGLEQDELIAMLSNLMPKNNAESFTELLLQEGIIE